MPSFKNEIPPTIRVTEHYDHEPNPRWNYARLLNVFTKVITLEPCCPKSEPCWECSNRKD